MRSGWPFGFFSETDTTERRVKSWDGHVLVDLGLAFIVPQLIPANEQEDRVLAYYALRLEGAGVAPQGGSFFLYKSEWDKGEADAVPPTEANLVRLPVTASFDPISNRWYSSQEIAGGEPSHIVIPAGYRLGLHFAIWGGVLKLRLTWIGFTAPAGLLWPLDPRFQFGGAP